MYFFRYGFGHLKGNGTDFLWVNFILSNICLLFLENNCASKCSIGLFLVLDRCLIACCVEMYAKLLMEREKGQ